MTYKWKGRDVLAPVTFKSNQDVWTVEKLDKSIDRLQSPGQRWELTFSTVDNQGEGELFAALVEGMSSKQTMPMINLNSATKSGSVTTTGASKGSTTVPLTGTIKPGTFIQFSNHTKVYAYLGTNKVFPALRADVPAGSVLVGDAVVFHYYIDDTVIQGINYSDGILSGIDSVTLLEAV